MKLKLLIIVFVFFGASCTHQSAFKAVGEKTLRIKGSDSMLLMAQRLSETFMTLHSDVSLYVEGGGSGSGIQSLLEGKIDICTSSRPMSSGEIQQLSNRFNSIGMSIICAKDALGIIVHPSNPVSNLSLIEIKKIFTGEITNWKDVGGADKPITVYSREPNSGTYVYLEEHILYGEPYVKNCIMTPGARALTDAVIQDSFAIGYSTNVYANNVKILSVNNLPPTADNIRKGFYPISRYLYLYTIQPPEGLKKEFIEWIISRDGQNIIKKIGYIPLFDAE